ncbi:unnamed protein product [Leptidea sinapis]|uniref:GST N-terminal domain-containing protein n=1 Tax=Leptidea sinapis TaxID=189913 RepID=A0A5E4QM31_9NEOP|nr:unnamed protein product [Leptidea sinapis]
MSEKHLKTGDSLPPYSGKLRLFAMRFCPYAERSVLVLNAKKLAYDLVFIDLDNKPEWIFSFNPKGSVPVLEYEEGKAIFDSTIINVYLDEKYPEKSLSTAETSWAVLKWVEKMSEIPILCALTPTSAETYHKGLEILQKEIESRGTTYLAGDQPGLIDYTIWPFLERFLALPLLGKTDFAIDQSKYEVLTVPAVKSYCLAPETHSKFTESRVKGNPDYNMLDTSDVVCCMRPRKKKE